MLRSALSLCPFCEARSFLPSKTFRLPVAQWQQQTRSLHAVEKRKPSRMILSSKVAQPPSKSVPNTSSKTAKRRSGDPFGHLNQTKVPQRVRTYQQHGKPSTGRSSNASTRTTTRKTAKSGGRGNKEREPFHALKMQQVLSTVSYGQRSKVKDQMLDVESFDEFPLLPIIKSSIASQALPGLADITPTPVQRVTLPALLGTDVDEAQKTPRDGRDGRAGPQRFLIAAETGSGKTLSYLLPVLDALKRNELADAEQQKAQAIEEAQKEEEKQANSIFDVEAPQKAAVHKDTARPRAIILVPTAELVTQVGALAKAFSHTVKFKAALISSAYTPTVIRNRLFAPSGIDLLISTPHLLSSLTESSPHILSRVTHLVIDEADSLLDRSFAPIVEPIIARSTPSLHQLILCSATIPRSLDTHLRTHFPSLRRLVTPNLHAIPRRVQLSVVDVERDPYRGNKLLACADAIWGIARGSDSTSSSSSADVKRIIVFVNERDTAVDVAQFLQSKGIDATALNRDTDAARRDAVLAEFRDGGSSNPHEEPGEKRAPSPNYLPPTSKKQGHARGRLINAKVLVSTDLGSRGIDTVAVRHVVLLDVPHSSVDFIHRLGRTGRMGRRGRGVVLVGKGDRRDVVREVREAMFRGQAMI